MSNDMDIKIRKNNAMPIYLAQATPAKDNGGTSEQTVQASGGSPIINPPANVSSVQTLPVKELVKKDIDLIDDMMLAEQVLTVRYMVELANQGMLTNIRVDTDKVPAASITALQGKYPRVGNKVQELAANANKITKKAFSSASNYYFASVYDRLSKASIQDQDLIKWLSITSSIESNDADFEKNIADNLVKQYRDPGMDKIKPRTLKAMIAEAVLVFRHMVEISTAGQLMRGWKAKDAVNENALNQIIDPGVFQKIKSNAGTAPLTKKAFADASNDYFKVLMKLESAIKDVNIGNDVIKQSYDQLNFEGISDDGLKMLRDMLQENDSKLLKSLKLEQVPDKPIDVLPAASRVSTDREEQYARGLVVLSRWLKGLYDQLPETPAVAAAPAPAPEIRQTETYVKALAVGDAEISVGTGAINGEFNASGKVKFTPNILYPHLNISVAADRFFRELEIGGGGKFLKDRVRLEGKYAIGQNDNLNANIMDHVIVQTLSASTAVRIAGPVGVKADGSASGLLTNGFSVPSGMNAANFAEADWNAGLRFLGPVADKKYIMADIDYGQAFVNPSLTSSADNKTVGKQFMDINVNYHPQKVGIYAGMGYRFFLDKEYSALPYSFLKTLQNSAHAEIGWMGLGRSQESSIGLNVGYGSKIWEAQIRFNGIISGSYMKKVIQTAKPVETAKTIETEKPVEPLNAVEVQKASEPQEPVETQQPAVVQQPAAVQKPVEAPKQVVVQQPVAVQKPVETPKQVAVQQPVAVQKPVEAPKQVAVQQPVAVQKPVETPKQVAVQQPVVAPKAPADTSKQAVAPKQGLVTKATTKPSPLTLQEARILLLISPLRLERDENPSKNMTNQEFSAAILDHKVYMALKLLGKNVQPGNLQGNAKGNLKALEDWFIEIKKHASKDYSIAVNWVPPAKPKPFDLPNYINMTALFDSDKTSFYKDTLFNKDKWAVVGARNDNDNDYIGKLADYSDWLKKFLVNTTKPSLETMKTFLNFAWTENVGKPEAAGTVNEKVVLLGTEAGQIVADDNTYNDLKGKSTIKYDSTTHAGTFITTEQQKGGR